MLKWITTEIVNGKQFIIILLTVSDAVKIPIAHTQVMVEVLNAHYKIQ